MSSSSSRRLSRINIPRIVLWLASVVVGVLGYLLMTTSNNTEATIYTAGTADYPALFAAQSGSTVGGMLIVIGVLGLLLALTSMAITRRPAAAPEVAVVDASGIEAVEFIDVTPVDVAPAAAPAAEIAPDAEVTAVR